MTRIHAVRATVTSNRRVGPGIWRLGVHAKEIARAIRPGQFVNLLPGPALDPLLPRPFSVFRRDGDVLEFLVQVVGKGTSALSALKTGDRIECSGPLGHGFSIPRKGEIRHVMVAGGIGVAPFYALGKELRATPGHKVLLYGAASSAHFVCLGDFREACLRVETIPVQKGFVTVLLEKELAKPGPVQLYACGPTPMLQAVWRMALDRNVPCQLSLETPMACGFGICKGCSFPRRGAVGYTLVCKEGPVYEAAAIDFR